MAGERLSSAELCHPARRAARPVRSSYAGPCLHFWNFLLLWSVLELLRWTPRLPCGHSEESALGTGLPRGRCWCGQPTYWCPDSHYSSSCIILPPRPHCPASRMDHRGGALGMFCFNFYLISIAVWKLTFIISILSNFLGIFYAQKGDLSWRVFLGTGEECDLCLLLWGGVVQKCQLDWVVNSSLQFVSVFTDLCIRYRRGFWNLYYRGFVYFSFTFSPF